jgi:hypothetical protein
MGGLAEVRPPFPGERLTIKTWLRGESVEVGDPLLRKAFWLYRRWTGTGDDYEDEDAHLMDLMQYIGSEAALIAKQRAEHGW